MAHARYARNLRAGLSAEAPRTAGIGLGTWRLVGRVSGDRTDFFLHFPTEKAPGTVRIGCFGDSFTHGDEVADGLDFPALLARRLAAGGARVEVLNFGMPWHGFHQSFMLWDREGRRYGLDYVVLGPAGFQPERDTTFQHAEDREPSYLHALYVLDGGGVRLVEVAGTTPGERLDQYLRLVPRWDYLRYDRRAPAALRALVPAGFEVRNPFYYHWGSWEEEAHETYRRLIAAVARSGVQVLLPHLSAHIAALGSELNLPNVAAWPLHEEPRFPYLAPQGHFSPLGNALVAEQVAIALTQGEPVLDVVRTEDVARLAEGADDAPRRVEELADVRVALDDVVVGGFADANRGAQVDPRAIVRTHARSLLGLEAARDSLLDACFVPTEIPLHAGAAIEARQEGRREMLARVDPLAANAAIATARLVTDTVTCSEETGLVFRLAAPGRLVDGRVTIAVGEDALLIGQVAGGTVTVLPRHGGLLRIRAGGNALPPPIWLRADGGDVRLLYRRGGVDAVPLRIARWRRVRVSLDARVIGRPLPGAALPAEEKRPVPSS